MLIYIYSHDFPMHSLTVNLNLTLLFFGNLEKSEVRVAASRGVLAEAKRRTRLTRLSKLRASASAARSTVSSVLAPSSPSPPSEPVVPLAPEVASHDPPEVQGCGCVMWMAFQRFWMGFWVVFLGCRAFPFEAFCGMKNDRVWFKF